MDLINCFFFFSIFGFLFESLTSIILKKPYNSSVLYGPWTTVYGIAFFIIHYIGTKIEKFHLKKWQEVILVFLGNIFILSILELIAGELILKLFHVRYWNYEKFTWNIDGFICLEVSLFWGIGALFLYYFLYPKVKSFIMKIPTWLTYLFLLFYVIDLIFMFMKFFS